MPPKRKAPTSQEPPAAIAHSKATSSKNKASSSASGSVGAKTGVKKVPASISTSASTSSSTATSKSKMKVENFILLSDSSDDAPKQDGKKASKDSGPKGKGKAKSQSKGKAARKAEKLETSSPVKKKAKVASTEDDLDDTAVGVSGKKKSSEFSSGPPNKAKSSNSSSLSSKAKTPANPPATPAQGSALNASTSSRLHKPKKDRRYWHVQESVTYEKLLKEWFSHFVDSEDEGDSAAGGKESDDMMMRVDGIESLFEEMKLSMDSVHPLLLAWNVGAEFGKFRYKDFKRTLEPFNICDSEGLANHLAALKHKLYPPQPAPLREKEQPTEPVDSDPQGIDFRWGIPSMSMLARGEKKEKDEFASFYTFLFPFLKEEGSKTLPKETALPVLKLVLAEKYKLANEFIEFAEEQGDNFKSIGQDFWSQFLEFLKAVSVNLEGWSEMDAWPSTIDQFVGWKQAKAGTFPSKS